MGDRKILDCVHAHVRVRVSQAADRLCEPGPKRDVVGRGRHLIDRRHRIRESRLSELVRAESVVQPLLPISHELRALAVGRQRWKPAARILTNAGNAKLAGFARTALIEAAAAVRSTKGAVFHDFDGVDQNADGFGRVVGRQEQSRVDTTLRAIDRKRFGLQLEPSVARHAPGRKRARYGSGRAIVVIDRGAAGAIAFQPVASAIGSLLRR